jgi:hypothetical protein
MNTEEKEEPIAPPAAMDDKMASVMLSRVLAIDRNIERCSEFYMGMRESLNEAKKPLVEALEAFMRQRYAEHPDVKEVRYAPGTVRLRQVPPHVELKDGVNLADHKDNRFVKVKYDLDRAGLRNFISNFTSAGWELGTTSHAGHCIEIDLPDFVTIERGGLSFSYSANNGVQNDAIK